MGKKNSLQKFLQREVVKHRIRLPSPPRKARPVEDHEVRLETPEAGEASATYDNDSLFGEPILTKEELFDKQLKELLSAPPTDPSTLRQPPQPPVNPNLEALKDELRTLMSHDGQGSERERAWIRRQKSALVEEVTRLQSEKKEEQAKVNIERYRSEHRTLPDPISQQEKRQFDLTRSQIKKARLGGKKRPKRERDENLDDLDGEERLRLGVTTKRKATKLTGHWNSSIHDYFPGMGGEGEDGEDSGVMTLRDVAADDRVLLRRELAEMGARLAREERRKQRSAV